MDDPSRRCLHCGASVPDGRFCTNCGARLDTEPTNPRRWPAPTDTAERVYQPAERAAYAGSTPPAAPAAYAAPAYLAPDHKGPRHPGPGPGLWIGAAVVMVVVLVLGGYLLLHGAGGGGGDHASATPPIVPPTRHRSSTTVSPSPSPSVSSSAASVTGPPTNVAGFAEATAPRHAPGGVDFAGRPVTYVAPNMVDGRNDTCWRTPGDATGTVLTFRLDQPTRLSRVGLVNGYAKIAYSHGRPFDWYLGNRRVRAVEWVFDDGTTVPQRLGNSRAVQQRTIAPVTTSVVRLRITSVSPPGHGRAARNDTAISEVFLLGRTAS